MLILTLTKLLNIISFELFQVSKYLIYLYLFIIYCLESKPQTYIMRLANSFISQVTRDFRI